MGSVFFVVGPVAGENLVGFAAEQEVEFLENVVDLFAERFIEIGHRPAAELEALGRILGRSARRLHDAIHGNLGAHDDLAHGVTLLVELLARDLGRLAGRSYLFRSDRVKNSIKSGATTLAST